MEAGHLASNNDSFSLIDKNNKGSITYCLITVDCKNYKEIIPSILARAGNAMQSKVK